MAECQVVSVTEVTTELGMVVTIVTMMVVNATGMVHVVVALVVCDCRCDVQSWTHGTNVDSVRTHSVHIRVRLQQVETGSDHSVCC